MSFSCVSALVGDCIVDMPPPGSTCLNGLSAVYGVVVARCQRRDRLTHVRAHAKPQGVSLILDADQRVSENDDRGGQNSNQSGTNHMVFLRLDLYYSPTTKPRRSISALPAGVNVA
ncbi:hypothetical protein PSP6_690106 [Paraburkholderia tropica]|nr:hypothetical protein PSP6_690106 [Paraburkholderia tropica]